MYDDQQAEASGLVLVRVEYARPIIATVLLKVRFGATKIIIKEALAPHVTTKQTSGHVLCLQETRSPEEAIVFLGCVSSVFHAKARFATYV